MVRLSPKKSPPRKKDSPPFNSEEQNLLEKKNLNEGETNWYEVLTSAGFVIRLVIVLLVAIYCTFVILCVTMNENIDSWYYKLYKPDWGPDGVIIAILFAFVSILLAWVWYRFSKVTHHWYYEALIVVILVLQVLWAIFLYQDHNVTVARYLICFYLGLMSILFLLSIWVFGFSDVTLYTFIYVAWLVVMTFYSFGLHELDKEYKILGTVTDKDSSLYRKKVRLEVVHGIRVNEDGEKIEVDPFDQE